MKENHTKAYLVHIFYVVESACPKGDSKTPEVPSVSEQDAQERINRASLSIGAAEARAKFLGAFMPLDDARRYLESAKKYLLDSKQPELTDGDRSLMYRLAEAHAAEAFSNAEEMQRRYLPNPRYVVIDEER